MLLKVVYCKFKALHFDPFMTGFFQDSYVVFRQSLTHLDPITLNDDCLQVLETIFFSLALLKMGCKVQV